MNRPTSSYSTVIVLLRLIAIFFAKCLLCPTITENSSNSNPCVLYLNATLGTKAREFVFHQSGEHRAYCTLLLREVHYVLIQLHDVQTTACM